MLRRPSATFQKLVVHGNDDFSIIPVMLAGVSGLLIWADLFNLGQFYQPGQIWSGALILGPIIGWVWLGVMTLLGLWLGNLLDKRHSARYQYHVLIPPFPLKNLLWVKVFGAEGFRRMFSKPILRHYLQAWSWIYAKAFYLKGSVSGSEIRYPVLLGGMGKLAGFFVPLTIVLWFVAVVLGHDGFGHAEGTRPMDPLFLALKIVSLLVFIYFWLRLLRASFDLNWTRTLAVGLISLILSLATILWLVSFLTGIRWM
jgi:hypothetical protein